MVELYNCLNNFYLIFHQLLDDRSTNQQNIIDDDQNIPQIKKFKAVVLAKTSIEITLEIFGCFLMADKNKINLL
jgi:hypothetical protein